MSVLSWGKCKIEHTTSTNGTPASDWTELDVPKEDTTQLSTTAGNEKQATEEGGELVDYTVSANTYELSFDLFVKKGKTRPFSDRDGVVAGEHAFRITPEDTECEGILIERAALRVEISFTTANGILLHHVAKGLKPATGNTVKPYTASATQ